LAKLYSQYVNAPKFQKLIDELSAVLTIPISQFYNDFFNLYTCTTQGLDNWGIILNTTRDSFTYDYAESFGFDTGEPNPTTTEYPQNFGHGSFFSTSNRIVKIKLNDTQYRIVLLLQYAKYTSDMSMASCTAIVNNYIQFTYEDPTYKCTVKDNHLAVNYHFNYSLSAQEVALFKINKLLPKPAGIEYSVTWES